jgi:hypothetical protein
MNLVDPFATTPLDAYELVDAALRHAGAEIGRAELVGLVPDAVLHAIPRARWAALDLDVDRTIEARLARRGERS